MLLHQKNNKMTKEYVLGFAFSLDRTRWVGIIKNRPESQNGLINGLGGKIEKYDVDFPNRPRFNVAMCREFNEESGVIIEEWDLFAKMEFKNDIEGGSAIVYCLRSFTDDIFNCESKESEQIVLMNTGEYDHPTTANVPMLIQMALNKDLYHSLLIMGQ